MKTLILTAALLAAGAAHADTQFHAQPYVHQGIAVNVKSIHLGWDGKLWFKLLVGNGSGRTLTVDRNMINAHFADGRAKSREVSVWAGRGKAYVIPPNASHELFVEYMLGHTPMKVTLKMMGFSLDGVPVQMPDFVADPNPPRFIAVTKEKIELKQKVQFATDRADILPASYAMLDEIADVLRGRPELRVRVEGHTDGRGTIDHNLRLSQTRAESVRAYLSGKGVEQSHLDARGYGPTRPIADDKNPAGQEKNRRVEFVITAQ